MRTVLLKRFSGGRIARILGWTTAAVTWGAVAISSALADSGQAEPTPPEPPPDPTTTTIAEASSVDSFPQEPAGGLVILRGIPVENPEPVTIVKRVVVQAPGPSVSPAPPTQSSSGS